MREFLIDNKCRAAVRTNQRSRCRREEMESAWECYEMAAVGMAVVN